MLFLLEIFFITFSHSLDTSVSALEPRAATYIVGRVSAAPWWVTECKQNRQMDRQTDTRQTLKYRFYCGQYWPSTFPKTFRRSIFLFFQYVSIQLLAASVYLINLTWLDLTLARWRHGDHTGQSTAKTGVRRGGHVAAKPEVEILRRTPV